MSERIVPDKVEVQPTIKDDRTGELEDTALIRFRVEVTDGEEVKSFTYHRTSCPVAQITEHLEALNQSFRRDGESELSPATIAQVKTEALSKVPI